MRQSVFDGQQYGKLTVVGRHDTVKGNIVWKCTCACGQETLVNSSNLRSGKTVSCGCVRREVARRNQTRHGMCGTRIYKVWVNMKDRVLNPNNSKYHLYGGKGIKICQEWTASFDAFFRDMGEPPTPAHTIERKDGNGDYCPGNCCWATRQEQMNNISRNRCLTYDGRTQTLAMWARERGINPKTLQTRVSRGLDAARALGFEATE